jgi:hypothetical protein
MGRKKLKLYVWDGVLCDWTCGIAFALAPSAEEAKEMLMKQGLEQDYYWKGLQLQGVDPIEVTDASAFVVYGGG